jgi:hypothetical protein
VSKNLQLVVLGIMGRMPFAGVAWQTLHYLEGFRRLGCDVYYVEDTSDWPYDPEKNAITGDCSYTVRYLERLMTWLGMADHWAYRSAADGGRTFGLLEPQVSQLFDRTEVLVNLCGATRLRDEHLGVPVRIYLETDPVVPQIEVAQGRAFTIDLLGAHTHHFTYGESLGRPDCDVPLDRFEYQATRQPIILDWWTSPHSNGKKPPPPAGCFTTIANWYQSGKNIQWNGETYSWSKHLEFLKFIDLPRRTQDRLELALASVDIEAVRMLTANGWQIADAMALSKDILPYRDYILGSRAEFTVAKDQNVRLRSGWFSDRSACYLAAGRPVITQETGFSRLFPTGKGLFGFTKMDEILAAVEAIASDYDGNCHSARALAAEYFTAEKVLGRLLARAGL